MIRLNKGFKKKIKFKVEFTKRNFLKSKKIVVLSY